MTSRTWGALLCIFGALPCQEVFGPHYARVPDYVLRYAPVVYLHSGETFFPGSIAGMLEYTKPQLNRTDIEYTSPALSVNNLELLNDYGSQDVTLSSIDDFTKLPSWLHGIKPDHAGRVAGEPSSAVITRDLGNGSLYAFYMFFYPFNFVPVGVGLHVGDWEHFALRFDNEVPTQAWYSQHSGGSAYTFGTLQKEGDRPVVYPGNGTHANYPTQGSQPGLAQDKTNNGTRWDPTLSAYLIRFEPGSGDAHGTFSSYTPGQTTKGAAPVAAPTDWLYYLGLWGDLQLLPTDRRQQGSGIVAKYTNGPTGPYDKKLDRNTICDGAGSCDVRKSIP